MPEGFRHVADGAVRDFLQRIGIVPADQIGIVVHLDDAVEHGVAAAFVQGDIILFEARFWHLDDHQIPFLMEHREHTYPFGLVYQSAIMGEDVLECAHSFIAPMPRRVSSALFRSASSTSRGASYCFSIASRMASGEVSSFKQLMMNEAVLLLFTIPWKFSLPSGTKNRVSSISCVMKFGFSFMVGPFGGVCIKEIF